MGIQERVMVVALELRLHPLLVLLRCVARGGEEIAVMEAVGT